MKIYSPNDYKKLPWKNGKGFTRELYRLPDPNNSTEFVFRLSQASITQDGPFSIFPHIHRTLLLLKGEGVHLVINDQQITLDHLYDKISFSGDIPVHCQLIGGPCEDFNIMSNDDWKNYHVQPIKIGKSERKILPKSEHFIYIAQGIVLCNGETVSLDHLVHSKEELVIESQEDSIFILITILP